MVLFNWSWGFKSGYLHNWFKDLNIDYTEEDCSRSRYIIKPEYAEEARIHWQIHKSLTLVSAADNIMAILTDDSNNQTYTVNFLLTDTSIRRTSGVGPCSFSVI